MADLTAVAVVLVPARAGGGQGANPGSSGGGSPSVGAPGGGAGGGFPLLPLLGGSPVFVILFLVGTMVMRTRGRRAGPGAGRAAESGPPSPPPPAPARTPALEAGLARIASHDPAFDEPGLLTEAEGIHALVSRSWLQLDPEMARSVVAEPLLSERRRALEAKAARGERPHADELHIGRADVVAATVDEDAGTETVVVRIHTYSRAYDLDADGQLLSGDQELRLWSEDWHLIRPTSEVTRRATGTSQVCPRCGSPLSLADDGTCTYCHAQVAAGASGWQVIEIRPVLS